jgi:hypothetical protein
MKRDRISLSAQQSVETYIDGLNGRVYIAYSSGSSAFMRDTADLRRFLKIPKGIPMREALDGWLAELLERDAKKKNAAPAPVGDAHVEGSWDPQAHLDEGDPNFQTRTIT